MSGQIKIYINGNCQGPALSGLLNEACGATIEADSLGVHDIEEGVGFDWYRDKIRSSDIVFSQPISSLYRNTDIFSLDWIRENVRRDASVLTFPVIYLRAPSVHSFSIADLHDGALSYHDAHAIEYFLMGKSVHEYIDDTSRSDFLPADFVISEAFNSLNELLRREHSEETSISVCGILSAMLMTRQSMFTFNHPSRAVLAQVGNRLLAMLNREERIPLEGRETLDQVIMPPYLSEMLAFNHDGMGLNMDAVRISGTWESRTDYFKHVFDRYRSLGNAALRGHVERQPEIGAYIRRFYAAQKGRPVNDPRQLIELLYKYFIGRIPDSGDVLHHLTVLKNFGYERTIEAFFQSDEYRSAGGGAAMDARFDEARGR